MGRGQGAHTASAKVHTLLRPRCPHCASPACQDPDFLETLFPITMNEVDSRTEYTFWSLWSAPLLVATDVRNMCTLEAEKRCCAREVWDERPTVTLPSGISFPPLAAATMKSIIANEEVIAIDQVGAVSMAAFAAWPLSRQRAKRVSPDHRVFPCQDPLCKAGDRLYNSTEKTQAWRKTLHDGNLAVVLYNAHNFKTQDVAVTWKQVRAKATAFISSTGADGRGLRALFCFIPRLCTLGLLSPPAWPCPDSVREGPRPLAKEGPRHLYRQPDSHGARAARIANVQAVCALRLEDSRSACSGCACAGSACAGSGSGSAYTRFVYNHRLESLVSDVPHNPLACLPQSHRSPWPLRACSVAILPHQTPLVPRFRVLHAFNTASRVCPS